MHRLSVSLVAVAAVAAGAAAQPRPVWTKELTVKKATMTSVVEVTFSPDGRTLLALAVAEPTALWEPSRCALWGFDARDRRELFQVDVMTPLSPPGPPQLAAVGGDRVVTAFGDRVDVRGGQDGRVVSTRTGTRLVDLGSREWDGVWAVGGNQYVLLVQREEVPGPRLQLLRGTLPARADDMGGWKEVRSPAVAALRPTLDLVRTRMYVTAVSPDGDRLAVFEHGKDGKKGTLGVYDIREEEGELKRTLLGRVESPHPGQVSRVRFSSDGKTLASGSLDGTVKLWGVPAAGEGWRARVTVAGPDFTVNDLAFRPDGKVLALVTNDTKKSNVWLVDVGSGTVIGSFRVGGAATAVAFTPDGKTLATGNHHGRLEVWDVEQVMAGQKK